MSQTPIAIDTNRTDAFGERMMDVLNSGALSVMISLGHRAGLYDAMENQASATSQEIARQAGLDERYVREWLGSMVTARVIDYVPETKQYVLPAEHSAWLARSAGSNCLAGFAQYVPLLGTVELDVLDCFRNGGGVPYERFEQFKQVMADDSEQSVVQALESHILPAFPALRERLASGVDVLDVGCGSGRAINKLARLFPNSRFTGYDLLPEHVEAARAQARDEGLGNVRFEVRDCTHLGESDTFDVVTTFDAIHDQKSPLAVLTGIRQALRPGGLYLMQEIKASSHLEQNVDHPIGPFLYAISTMHCMTVSLAQGGDGVGTMWGREMAKGMLAEAGFGEVELKELDHDEQNEYYLCHPA